MRKERTLHDVAKLGKLKDVQVFVAKKVDLNELDRHGVTPIFYAVAQGHLEVVRYLADSGAGEDFLACVFPFLFLYIYHNRILTYFLYVLQIPRRERRQTATRCYTLLV